MTETNGRPDWCTWWTPVEWATFRALVEDAATHAGLSATVDDQRGLLVVGRGSGHETRYSLDRAAHHARHRPTQEWPAIIEQSLQIGRDRHARLRQLRTADLQEVQSRLKAHVFADSWGAGAGGSVVTRPLGADLIEALTLDLAEDQSSVNVTPEDVRRWGLPVEELFAIGRENIRTEPVRRVDPVPGIRLLVGEQSHGLASFAASWLSLLGEEPGVVESYGCFVVVPNHRMLAYHPVEGPECLNHNEILSALLEIGRVGFDTHERLSARLYWWAAGRVREVPISVDEGGVVVGFPPIPFDAADGWSASEPGPADAPERGDPDTVAYVGAHLMFAGRLAEAEQWLGRAADRGHAEAMSNLGVLLSQTGRIEEAERCLRRAAEHGHDGALTNLGAVVDNAGRAEQAESWFRRAAERGHTHGMHMLGRLLRRTKRDGEAEQWLRRAAEQGATEAMVDLSDPLVVAKRYDDAEPWLRRAAEQRDPSGMVKLSLLLTWTERHAEAADWLQRAADTRHPAALDVAERWFRPHAERGLTDSMRRLGKLLADSDRVDEARRWYRRAAEAGDPEAMKELALLLEQAGDSADAESWYRRAIEAGNTEAMYDLGFLLKETGRVDEAEQWYRSAADAGMVRAMTNLGTLLNQTDRPDEAEQWTSRAAELGSTTAMRNLGSLHLLRAGACRKDGLDTAADEALAETERWYGKAAELGDAEAMYTLGVMAESRRPNDAQRWYRQACDGGHPQALDRLAALLGPGDGPGYGSR